MSIEEQIQKNLYRQEQNLSPYATLSQDAIRLYEEKEDIRPPFFHDTDRIIHALSYTRYLNKTQVYPFQENDHVSKRIVHVQFVSKIARTIGRGLCLNEDLIEAIALGHDIGHTPLGHAGEKFLNKIAKRELQETFAHNIQSVRNYMCVENGGKGFNLTIQVLDGIMCHNGEILSPIYQPTKKTKEDFLNQYDNSFHDLEDVAKQHPMTLEGCVVRISDMIAYIGRDIEDAILLGCFKREQLPKEITAVLGTTNREIINTIVNDILKESLGKPYIKLSEPVYQALLHLKKFNYEYIYEKSTSKEALEYYEQGMNTLFYAYLEDLEKERKESAIYQTFLNHKIVSYQKETSKKRQVLDFLSGMTDSFFLEQLKKRQQGCNQQ